MEVGVASDRFICKVADFILNVVCKPRVANIGTVLNSDVMFDKFKALSKKRIRY